MNKLAQWIYAYKLCRKYNILWMPVFRLSHAEFKMTYYKDYKKTECTVFINPFYQGFMDSFLHEVGHILRHRRMYYRAKSCAEYEQSVADTMKEEYIAWKFAKRVQKNRFDSTRARELFQTYWKRAKREYGCAQKATDVFHSYDRML